MPRNGWKSIALRQEYFDQLEEKATAEGRAVSNYLERQLLANGIIKEEANSQ